MGVPKGDRKQSSIEFEQLYYSVTDCIDDMVENNFYVKISSFENNKIFITKRAEQLEWLSDKLLYHIKIANSIYPICITEWEERRTEIDKAIGVCFAILATFQRILYRLDVNDTKYEGDTKVIMRMIQSLKAWRVYNNKLKGKIINNN